MSQGPSWFPLPRRVPARRNGRGDGATVPAQPDRRLSEEDSGPPTWVAILAVPPMVFALYGMNFEHTPELGWTYGYPAVIGAVLSRKSKRTGWQ